MASENEKERVKLTRMSPNLPEKIREKYGYQGVTILAASKEGVAVVAAGKMTLKTVSSMIKACEEYRDMLTAKLEERLRT